MPSPAFLIPPIAAVPGAITPEIVRPAPEATEIDRALSFRETAGAIEVEPDSTVTAPFRITVPEPRIALPVPSSVIAVEAIEASPPAPRSTSPPEIIRPPSVSLAAERKEKRPSP